MPARRGADARPGVLETSPPPMRHVDFIGEALGSLLEGIGPF
jgi:hypothetical protein